MELFAKAWFGSDGYTHYFIDNQNNISYSSQTIIVPYESDEKILEELSSGLQMPWTGDLIYSVDEPLYENDCLWCASALSIVYDFIDFEFYAYGNTENEARNNLDKRLEWLRQFWSDDKEE